MKIVNKVVDSLYSLVITSCLLAILLLCLGKPYLDRILFENIISFNYRDGIYYTNDVNFEYLDSIKECLLLTGDLYDKFLEENGYILYTENFNTYKISSINENKNYTTVGFFRHNKEYEIIMLRSGYEYCLSHTIIHEMGHFLDYLLDDISNSKEFEDLYNKYLSINLNDYGRNENYEYVISNKSEFFAERYSNYILNPQILKEVEPEIYTFMENCMKEVSK